MMEEMDLPATVAKATAATASEVTPGMVCAESARRVTDGGIVRPMTLTFETLVAIVRRPPNANQKMTRVMPKEAENVAVALLAEIF